MMLGVLGMIAGNVAALLGACRLLDAIRTNKPSVDFLLLLILRALLISGTVLVAGLLHLLTPPGLSLIAILALAILLATKSWKFLPRPGIPPWNRWLIAASGLLLLKLLLQAWVFAPYAGDVVSYHLPKMAEWMRAGTFTRELGLNPRVTLPAGFELLEAWWVGFLRHDVLIEMAGIEMLFLGAAAAYALARELQGTPSCALGGALLFALTPGLQIEATSCLNDTAAAAMTVATAALIVARADWPLLLLVAGFGAGLKPTYLYALPGLALLEGLLRREVRSPVSRTLPAWTVAGVALAVGAAWYFRNLLWFGNPVYPMGTELGRQIQQVGPSAQSLRENLITFLDVRIYDRFPVGALHTGNANWGAAAFAVGVPALIAWLREDARFRKVVLAFAASATVMLSLVTLDAWNMRFILFVPALPALAAARLASRQRLVLALVAAAALLCFASTVLPSELPKPVVVRLLQSGWKERTARPDWPPVPGEDAVGCAGDELPGVYWLYGPGFSRRVVYLRESSSTALMERLRREAVRKLYVSPRAAETAVFRESVAAGDLEPFVDGMGRGFRRVR